MTHTKKFTTPFSKSSTLVIGVMLFVLLHSCDPQPPPQYILFDDFENDVMGAKPSKSPFGQPPGDELLYGPGINMSIVETPYASAYQSLDYDGGGPIHFTSQVSSFIGTVIFKWSGAITSNPVNGVGQCLIDITDGFNQPVAKLVFTDSHLIVKHKNSDPFDPLSGTIIGAIPYPPNSAPIAIVLEISVRLFSGVYDVQLITGNGDLFDVNNIPIYEQNTSLFSTTPRPAMTFLSNKSGISGSYFTQNGHFILDRVTIHRVSNALIDAADNL